MKKYIITIGIALCCLYITPNIFGQVAWNTGLNPVPTGQSAFFGTNTPYPLRVYTQNEDRMHINQNVSNVINSQPSIARNGYVGIGRNQTPATIWNSPGPISLLHLNGDEGTVMGTQGYRNWMRNSITITSNNDLMFMGPRRRGANDITDAVIGWADNPAGPGVGPDNMLFVFSTGTGTGTDLDGGGADGREIMRMNANGNIGVGPRFGNASQPQSQLHINAENTLPAWLQITNQSNTGQVATDGLRMGVNGTDAYIYNQENAHLILSTNATTANLARERMRITHIGAAGTPVTAAAGSTRLSVSLNPASPLTAPRSLVHIGENTGGTIPGTDGVRNWMDVGYLATVNSDNIYVGLKREGDDRQDAVVAWGDNQTDLVNGSGPDNLRFIFANSQYALSPGTPESKSDNGQEVARFTPVGQLGIGNFAPAFPNAPGTANYVGATLDVDGDARIRTVTQNNALTQVLVRDPADLGRLKWRDAATLGGGGGGLGNDCGTTPNPLSADKEIPLADNDLYFSGQSIPADGNTVNVGITCGAPRPAKFNVLQNTGVPIPANTIGASFSNTDTASTILRTYVGVSGSSTALQDQPRTTNIGGDFMAHGGGTNYAIRATTTTITGAHNNMNYAGMFQVSGIGGANNMGIYSYSVNGGANIGVNGAASSTNTFTVQNTGGFFSGVGSAQRNYGIYATGSYPDNPGPTSSTVGVYGFANSNTASTATYPANSAIGIYGRVDTQFPVGVSKFAGYFDGDVFIGSTTYGTGYVMVSDSRFKTNVGDIRDAAQIIAQLQPKTYDFINGNDIGMDFPANHQYGFIAQEVEVVLPELVSEVKKPAMVDSLGNVVTPELKYKGLNYNGFIALLMQDAKDKNLQLEQQVQINTLLMDKINELSDRIDACCNAPKNITRENPEPTGAVIQTRLENNGEPALGQNIPNPFESATRIPAYVPQDTRKAEIMFYANDGKVLRILPINDRGSISVDVDAATLAAGVYSYTLLVDGKPVDTKRMVKQ